MISVSLIQVGSCDNATMLLVSDVIFSLPIIKFLSLLQVIHRVSKKRKVGLVAHVGFSHYPFLSSLYFYYLFLISLYVSLILSFCLCFFLCLCLSFYLCVSVSLSLCLCLSISLSLSVSLFYFSVSVSL